MTTTNNKLVISATKYELVKIHEGKRTVNIPKREQSKYMDSVVREYTNKGYTIAECTQHKTILRSACKTYLIVLINS